jgi:beta-glucosidase-like glycosyl hydrolase
LSAGRFNFTGFVVSDWGATHRSPAGNAVPFARRSRRRCGVQCWAFRSTGASLASGLDIEMPNGVFYTEDKIQAAIENKTITMAVRARARLRVVARARACVRVPCDG